jgi:PAS domain S-box-containing protein
MSQPLSGVFTRSGPSLQRPSSGGLDEPRSPHPDTLVSADGSLPAWLLASLPEAIHICDAEGIIRYASPRLGEMLGCPEAELLGRNAAEFVHREDLERTRASFFAGIAQPESTRRLEARVRHADGSWRMLEMVGRSLRTPGGEPILIISSRDVSERKRAEEALRLSEEQYRRFFEDDLTGDFVVTPEGQLLACNPAFAEIMGFESVEQALTIKTVSLYPDPSAREILLERLRREKSLRRLELELRRSDGRPVHVIENVVGHFDENGELLYCRGYLFDVTEQRRLADERTQLLVRERAARAVAEAAERRAAFLAEVGNVLDSSLDYRTTLGSLARLVVPTLADYCLIDEATEEGGSRRVSVAHVDPEWEQVLLPDEQNPPTADPKKHPVIGVLRTGEPVLVPEVSEESLAAIAHDPEHLAGLRRVGLCSFVIVPLTARGRTLGAITLASSVSRRRYSTHDLELAMAVAARAALAVDNARLYSRAQQAARAREEVLAFVSHDLRNPLATVLLNASALMEAIPADRLWPEEREQLEWIARSSEQMNRVIQDLLDVARIETGRLPLKVARVSVGSLLHDACTLLQPLAAEKRVTLQNAALADRLTVRVDRERLLRVLSNLIGNSIKFTAPGGFVRIGVEALEHQIRFSVEDSGIGIAPEDRPYIFDRYWQGRRRAFGRDGGSGLGLAIAKGIVETHGGTIWFESAVGSGSTFYFTLPTSSREPRAAADNRSGEAFS